MSMKKIVLFLASCSLLSAGLVSCDEGVKQFEVTYRNAVNKLHELDYKRLSAKILDETINESFVLFTYDSNSPSCSCWLTIKGYLEYTYIPETHNLFYYIGSKEFSGMSKEESFNIRADLSQPTICFFDKGKLVKQLDYDHHKSLFEDTTGQYSEFKRVMNEYTRQQDKLYLFDKYQSVVSDMPAKSKAVFYAFKTSCSDCKAASSNVLFPYLTNKVTIDTKIYLLDIDKYADTSKYSTSEYQAVKDALKLSDKTPDFGFENGYVPTFQYWENGSLKDASVFFNDTISKDTESNKFYVTSSFYSESRKTKLSYLDNVQTKVIQGLEVPSSDINEVEYGGTTYYFWKADKAEIYHKPLLNAFLAKYVL